MVRPSRLALLAAVLLFIIGLILSAELAGSLA